MQITVGFDFDLTLADTRAGIARVWDWLAETTGVVIDSAQVAQRLGPPLEQEMSRQFPDASPERLTELVELFRSRYDEFAIPSTTAMPGALEAIAAVRAAGGRVLVISAKHTPAVKRHVDELGLDVDEVIGDAWAEQKGALLAERSATVYVGDHLGDVTAAKFAGAAAVGVATGPIDAAGLAGAGAEVVLSDLTEFPAWFEDHLLDTRLEALRTGLSELGSVLVAFSGGADSAFVLAAAVRALGPDQVVAATAVSPSLPQSELAPAAEFAASLGVRHLTPRTNEMDRAGYRANSGMRCYFCKSELLDVLGPLAAETGLAHVVTGTNADDAIAGFRPGIRAADERGAVTPLLAAGITKAQVREASRRWELPTWNKPAAACLSSRIAYGIEVTPTRLARVEHAESALRDELVRAGIAVRNLRVRDLGETARIEVDHDQVEKVQAASTVIERVRATGFDRVVVDPGGFRSGSMNELLPNPDRYR